MVIKRVRLNSAVGWGELANPSIYGLHGAGVRTSPPAYGSTELYGPSTEYFQNTTMEMKKINSGKLRAIGYDARARMLQVQLDNGSTLQYSGVGEDIWRRLSSSGAAWSFYRDNIEEEFTAQRVSVNAPAANNPLDDLFGKP